jgi:hypothetical protein
LDCLWCGPRVCCGASSFGEWLFLYIYRAPASRWFALVAQLAVLALDVLALALDRWSSDSAFVLPNDYTYTPVDMHVGLVSVRAADMSASYACPDAVGRTFLQCNIVRVGAGFVLALGLGACILISASIVWSLKLRCSLTEKAYVPALTLVSAAHTATLVAILLIWPLVPQLVLRDVLQEESSSSDLSLDTSWGVLLISWFVSLLLSIYMRGQVESISVSESNDSEAIEVARREHEERERLERVLAAERRLRDPYGLDASLGAASAGKVLLVSEAQMNLAAARAERAQWTQEGYGTDLDGSPLSPGAAYAAADMSLRNPLGSLTGALHSSLAMSASGRLPTLQRSYRANEPIPAPELLAPSLDELARREHERERARAMALRAEDERRLRREASALSGPYATTAPVLIDAEELDRQRHEQERAREHDELDHTIGPAAEFTLRDLQDNGLGQSAQQRIFGGERTYGPDGVKKPRSLYSYQSPDRAGAADTDRHPEGQVNLRVQTGGGVRGDDDADAPGSSSSALPPLPGPGEFRALDAKFVRDAMGLDEHDLAMLEHEKGAAARSHKKKKQHHQQQQQDDEAYYAQQHMQQEQQHQQRALPPMTPRQYREHVAAERETAPNLLQPAATPQAFHPHRLPPLQAQQPLPPLLHAPSALPPAFGRSGSQALLYRAGGMAPTPHYHYGPLPAQQQQQQQHPFVLQSPTRAQLAHDRFENRVYTYREPSVLNNTFSRGASVQQQHYHHHHHHPNLPSVSSRNSDVHFMPSTTLPSFGGTGSVQLQPHQQHGGYGLGDTQQSDAHLPPHLRQPSVFHFSPSHARSGSQLSVDVQQANSIDPLARTIATPMPVAFHTAAPTAAAAAVANDGALAQDEDYGDEDDHREAAHVRRVPLAPQTPRVLEAPQSAAVLRTPHGQPPQQQPSGPYSRAFGF